MIMSFPFWDLVPDSPVQFPSAPSAVDLLSPAHLLVEEADTSFDALVSYGADPVEIARTVVRSALSASDNLIQSWWHNITVLIGPAGEPSIGGFREPSCKINRP